MKPSTQALFTFFAIGLFSYRTLFSLNKLGQGGTLLEQDENSFFPPLNEASGYEIRYQTASQSPINDKTLDWNPFKRRLWMETGSAKPPAVVTLTSMYWNHPNQTFGATHFRTLRTRDLLEGVLNHPWFHPTAWDDIVAGRWDNQSDTRIYSFFDYETCAEKNFPNYGQGLGKNADTVGNRSTAWGKTQFHPQNPFRKLVNLTAMHHYPQMKLIIFDCGGEGPNYYCLSRRNNPYQQVSLASISASPSHHFPQDQGFPPPVVKEVFLNETMRRNIAECREDTRPYLMTFAGNFRAQVRKQLRDFVHDGRDILLGSRILMEEMGLDFEELVRLSKFGAAPRGDNRFSYRFAEVMSGGAIPVLYADDLVLPFENIINWTEIAVLIPENQTNRTKEILNAIGDAERCRMRQKMLIVYERYIRNGEANIAGIVEGLEEKFQTNQWAKH